MVDNCIKKDQRAEQAGFMHSALSLFINGQMTEKDLRELKQLLLNNGFGAGTLEKMDFLDIFNALYARKKVAVGDYSFLRECLKVLGLLKLCEDILQEENKIREVMGLEPAQVEPAGKLQITRQHHGMEPAQVEPAGKLQITCQHHGMEPAQVEPAGANYKMARKNSISAPYIVLLGDVGSGKSTLVEKLTGERGRSSNANESVTKISELFWVPDGSLLISDCPGANPMKEQFENNIWIASALNFAEVSKMFIVVKADTRIDNVVDNIRKYAERIVVNLSVRAVGVIVTHMDLVTWTMKDFIPLISNELGIKVVVLSALNTPAATLLHDILEVCEEKHDLSIDSDKFLKGFQAQQL